MGPLPSMGLPAGVDDAAEHRLAHGHLGDPARALDDVALLDVGVLAEDGDTHVVLFEVEDHAEDSARELEQFHGHALFHAVDPGDAVAHGEDRSGLG